MGKFIGVIHKKSSRFFKWVASIVAVAVAGIVVYTILSMCGKIECYVNEVKQEANASGSRFYSNMTITLVFVIVVIYIVLSLYNLLSHRAEEDSRMHCLPILMAPLFLIIENAFLHLFYSNDDNYYQVTMTVISAIVVATVTFASLKFSFEITSKRNRFNETSSIKPDIVLTKKVGDRYSVNVSHNRCYLSGIFIGQIETIVYWDIKKYGHWFYLDKLCFPNEKLSLKNDETQDIDFDKIADEKIEDLCTYARLRGVDIYLIFRDTQNYYYFAKLPIDRPEYNVIGVNELIITRLVYKFNKYNKTKKDLKCKTIKYESMDWFKIPYNLYP